MLRIVILLVTTVFLALADGSVLQTGQILSYDADGNVAPYGTIKDDGYYRAGVVRSYGRSGDVVIDNATGLEWQDNESIKKPWDEFEGDTAANYCAILQLGDHDDWRLPSIEELLSLVDYSQYKPSIAKGVFDYISTDVNYWSSTTYVDFISSAWYGNFSNGSSDYGTKSSRDYVRCVRNGQSVPFVRVRVGEIVFDGSTGLQWQDDSYVKTMERSWIEAINYCENTLTLGGYSDWRLPNINELLSIVNYFRNDLALVYGFQNYTSSYYWSSTTDSFSYTTDDAWQVNFEDGGSSDIGKSNNDVSVRCVRGGQINVPVNPAIIMYLLN